MESFVKNNFKVNFIGIGIDIEEIKRFTKLPFDENEDFYKKIFTFGEIKYCLKKKNPYLHFAVRFCAKEATVKALNREVKNLLDIEIISGNEKPIIKSQYFKNKKAHLSMAHTKKIAIATVIIEKL